MMNQSQFLQVHPFPLHRLWGTHKRFVVECMLSLIHHLRPLFYDQTFEAGLRTVTGNLLAILLTQHYTSTSAFEPIINVYMNGGVDGLLQILEEYMEELITSSLSILNWKLH